MDMTRSTLDELDPFTNPQKYAGKLQGKVVRSISHPVIRQVKTTDHVKTGRRHRHILRHRPFHRQSLRRSRSASRLHRPPQIKPGHLNPRNRIPRRPRFCSRRRRNSVRSSSPDRLRGRAEIRTGRYPRQQRWYLPHQPVGYGGSEYRHLVARLRSQCQSACGSCSRCAAFYG